MARSGSHAGRGAHEPEAPPAFTGPEADLRTLTATTVLALQRTAGNRAVTALLQRPGPPGPAAPGGAPGCATVQRGLFGTSDPAEKAVKQEAKEKRRTENLRKEEHKRRESAEKKRIASERKRGKAKRKKLMDKSGGATGADQLAMNKDLNERFQALLTAEAKVKSDLLAAEGFSTSLEGYIQKAEAQARAAGKEFDEEAAKAAFRVADARATQKAYDQTWLTAPDDLRAVRPPRETAAERLQRQIDAEKAEYRSRHAGMKQAEKDMKYGRLLSVKVEPLYEELEGTLAKMRATDPNFDEDKAIRAFWDVQDRLDPKVKERRPEIGSNRDLAGRELARKRLGLRAQGVVVDKETEALGGVRAGQKEAAHAMNITGGGLGAVTGVGTVGVLGGQVGALGPKVPNVTSNVTAFAGGPDFMGDTAPLYTGAASGVTLGVTGVINEAFTVVSSVHSMSKIITEEEGQKDPKLWADTLDAAAAGVRGTAFALKTSGNIVLMALPAAENALSYAIPGVGIVPAIATFVTDTVHLGIASASLADVNTALANARRREQPGAQLDPLVAPLRRLQATYAKEVSRHAINVALDMSTIAASVAEVATAGAYGIASAIKGGIGLVKGLHSMSHFLASEIIAANTKRNRREWKKRKEGAAEALQASDTSTSVDAIIVLAKHHHDPVAIKFLKSYRLSAEDISTKNTYDLHKKIMKDLKADEDPKTTFDKIANGWEKVEGIFSWMGRKGQQVAEMYELRGHEGSGVSKSWWISKMWLKAMVSNEKFLRSKHQTEVDAGHKLLEAKREKQLEKKIGAKVDSSGPFEAAIGTVTLPPRFEEKDLERFSDAVARALISDLELAARADYHSDEWKSYFARVLAARLDEQAVGAK
jgi:hypothetical protein